MKKQAPPKMNIHEALRTLVFVHPMSKEQQGSVWEAVHAQCLQLQYAENVRRRAEAELSHIISLLRKEREP